MLRIRVEAHVFRAGGAIHSNGEGKKETDEGKEREGREKKGDL